MSFFTAKRLPFLAIVAAIPFCQLLSLCSSPHPAAALILPVTKTLPRKKEDRKKQKLPQNATPSMQAPAFMKREKGREGERGRIENDSIVGGGFAFDFHNYQAPEDTSQFPYSSPFYFHTEILPPF